MNAVTTDLKLENGEIVKVGMNFYALNLMTKYPGGLKRLQKSLKSMEATGDIPDNPKVLSEAMDAFAYLFWALVRAGGTVCTKEDCSAAIGFGDFPALLVVFNEFNKAAQSLIPKNASSRPLKK